jgi:hypothetical protein
MLAALLSTSSACVFPGDPVTADDPPDCAAIWELCPEGSDQVAACTPGARCTSRQQCGGVQICQYRDDVVSCDAEPACDPNDQQIGSCTNDAACAMPCDREQGCYSVTACGFTIYCQTTASCDAEPVCPPDAITLPGGCSDAHATSRCVEIEACGRVVGCEQIGPCLPQGCPAGSQPISAQGCMTDQDCRTFEQCGQPITCAYPSGCAPQDASGEGACDRLLGFRWDGQSCELVGGCSCIGPSCEKLYQDREACARDTAQCRR